MKLSKSRKNDDQLELTLSEENSTKSNDIIKESTKIVPHPASLSSSTSSSFSFDFEKSLKNKKNQKLPIACNINDVSTNIIKRNVNFNATFDDITDNQCKDAYPVNSINMKSENLDKLKAFIGES